MALPNKTDIQTLDWSYQGLPFGDVPANGTVITTTMDWSYAGLPFVTNPAPVVSGPTHLKTMFGVAKANIKTINGVAIANIKTINTID